MSIIQGYVSPQEAAERLGKSYSTVCRYVEKGQLDAIRERGVIYISEESLAKWTQPAKGNPNLLKSRKRTAKAG